jgi:hypothetical protein
MRQAWIKNRFQRRTLRKHKLNTRSAYEGRAEDAEPEEPEMEFIRYDAQEKDRDGALTCANGGDVEGLGGDFPFDCDHALCESEVCEMAAES